MWKVWSTTWMAAFRTTDPPQVCSMVRPLIGGQLHTESSDTGDQNRIVMSMQLVNRGERRLPTRISLHSNAKVGFTGGKRCIGSFQVITRIGHIGTVINLTQLQQVKCRPCYSR